MIPISSWTSRHFSFPMFSIRNTAIPFPVRFFSPSFFFSKRVLKFFEGLKHCNGPLRMENECRSLQELLGYSSRCGVYVRVRGGRVKWILRLVWDCGWSGGPRRKIVFVVFDMFPAFLPVSVSVPCGSIATGLNASTFLVPNSLHPSRPLYILFILI